MKAEGDIPWSELDDAELLVRIDEERSRAEAASSTWAQEARQAYNMVAGKQWDDEEISKLEEEERAPIVFNRVAAMVDAVCGSQVNNRQETKFLPRTMDDGISAEIWQAVLNWSKDQCDAEDEESEAFRDMTITGMGWTETRVDYTEDPQGRIVVERIDPLEMLWDPASNKKNLADARWRARIKRVPHEEVAALWPDYADATASVSRAGATLATRRQDGYRDSGRGMDSEATRDDGTVDVLEFQWCETETEYVFFDPNNPAEPGRVDAEGWRRLGERIGVEARDGLKHVKRPKRTWYRAFICGDSVMEKGPCPDPESSTFQCMTGRRDRNAQSWYGIVRAAIDPQKFANKWLVQSLHIINTQAKGGLMMDEDAATDIKQVEESWAKPGGVTRFAPGAMTRGAVQPKPLPQFPAGYDRLLQFAIGSLPDVTGINREALGTADREQAGVLEWQRKQAAQAVLAPLFDALRLYYKQHGRLMLRFIALYVPPDRQIRVAEQISNPNLPQIVQLSQLPDARNYDVVVDQAPTSPHQKMEVWNFLQPVLPALMKMGLPMPMWAEFLKFSPLPESAIEKMNEILQASAQQQQGPPPEVQKMQAEMQLRQQEAQQSAALEQQKAEANLALKVREAEIDGQIQLQKAQLEMELMQQKAEADLRIKEADAQQRMQVQQQEAQFRQAEEAKRTDAEAKAREAEGVERGRRDADRAMASQAEDNHRATMATLLEKVAAAMETMSAPRRVVRGPDGKAIGVEIAR